MAPDAPLYCRTVATLPAGLQAAVGNATSGNASEADKKTIASGAQELRDAADAAGLPDDLRAALIDGAALLARLSDGQALTESEANSFATTFENLGKAVNKACA